MMARGVRVHLHRIWGGWRPLLLGALLAFQWGTASFWNPWDMIAAGTLRNQITLLIIPAYLLLLVRDLRHPWEALVGVRAGSGEAWWGAQVLAAGATAVVLTVAMVVLFFSLALASHHWAWWWSRSALALEFLVNAHVIATWAPWWWCLDALALLALGLWAVGGVWMVLALWWRSGWAAWLVVMMLCLIPSELMGPTPGGFVVWLLPGAQFSMIQHWVFPGSPSPTWSIGYAVVLLAGTTLLGRRLVRTPPWDARHGEPTA